MAVEVRQLETWWNQLKKTGDNKARESLVTAYLPLVKYIAGRMAVGLPNTVDY
ncbi:MAG: RNA polymerase sigma factor WhiG, partial [Firmicutes bacterium]|nr:RNA polymerase sigma factor WhiG [Bacillota bacterium]